MSTVLSPTFIPSIIASYVDDNKVVSHSISKEVNSVWQRVWRHSSSDRFVSWLINERIINFREVKTKAEDVNLFSKLITPLLLDIASVSQERDLLYNLAIDLQSFGAFLVIIPKLSNTSHPQGLSYATHAINGVPLFQVPGIPTITNVTEKTIAALKKSINSYVIEYRFDNPFLELLVNDNGEWYFGLTTDRSGLLHELIHVMDKVREMPVPVGGKSYRWTNPDEERTIQRENTFLEARGEMIRLSHFYPFYYETYIKQTGTFRLFDALYYGVDGTVQKIVEKGVNALETSLDRVEFEDDKLELYAKAYLSFFMKTESEDVDLTFRKDIIMHKNWCLHSVVMNLVNKHPKGKKLANRLIEEVLQLASEFDRHDIISFVENLLQKISK